MAAVARGYLDDCEYLSGLCHEQVKQLVLAEERRIHRARNIADHVEAMWRGALCFAWMVWPEHNGYLTYLPGCYLNLGRISKLTDRPKRGQVCELIDAAHAVVVAAKAARSP